MKENNMSEKMSRVARGIKAPHVSDLAIWNALKRRGVEVVTVTHVAPFGDERWTWRIDYAPAAGIVGAAAFKHSRQEAMDFAVAHTAVRVRQFAFSQQHKSKLIFQEILAA